MRWVCPLCGKEEPYRIRLGRCIRCHDRAYLASGVSAPEWISDAEEAANLEDFALFRSLGDEFPDGCRTVRPSGG